jgi:hypothetical protein
LFATKTPLSVAQGAFISLFAFTLFNKQYSMQYVIWLAPFAVLNISILRRSVQKNMIALYSFWQFFELLFQFAFFQNILTNTGKSRGMKLANVEFSEIQYGVTSVIRYTIFLLFVCVLMFQIYQESRRANAKHINQTSHGKTIEKD